MSTLGSPIAWVELLEGMLPDLLHLVLKAWDKLPTISPDDHEDTITEQLWIELKRMRTILELPFYIHSQPAELNPAAGASRGRLDIQFLPTGDNGAPSEDIYFCLECKRLNWTRNGRRVSGAPQYVANGMMRFVTGQYGQAVRNGGMLGYVLDGDVTWAIARVKRSVRSSYAVLCMAPPGDLLGSSLLTDVPTARESQHRRVARPNAFRIHHLFVPC